MKHARLFRDSRNGVRLLCITGGAVLALCSAPLSMAQGPVLHAALTRASMHPLAAQVDPPGAEPAFPGQNNQGSDPEIKDDLFAGTEKFAKGASDVTEVNMDPNSLNLVHGPDSHRAHRTVLSVVRTYTYDKPGMYNPADVEEYRRKLETGDWHCSVHVRDLKSGESTDVCSKRRAPDMVENAIITTSPKSLTFIHNIRKTNGQGSSLDPGSFSGLMAVPGSSLALDMPGMSAEMQAQLLASTASIRAELPALLSQLQLSRGEMAAQRQQMDQQMKNFQLKLKPELDEQLKHLHQQLQENELAVPTLH